MDEKHITCGNINHDRTVVNVRQSMPEDSELYDLADLFKSFGDSTRIKILWALDKSEMCVCAISELLGMTDSAVSHQLKYLRQAKLVKFRREGKSAVYSLNDDHVKLMLEMGFEHIHEKQEVCSNE